MQLKTIFTVFLACLAATLQAQGPNKSKKYYQGADGQKGGALKTALFAIIKEPNVVSYNGLLSAYGQTDTRADGSLRDWYSNATDYTTKSTGSYQKEGDVYNREHCMPQSWYEKAGPMRSDIVQVIPTDGYVNNRRSDLPYGEVGTPTWVSLNSYSKVGLCRTPGYTDKVFEPNDSEKGDIARIYFYMMTCYEDRMLSWNGGTASNVIDLSHGTKLLPLQQWVLDMMLRWSLLDPVDDVERARNDAVYAVQKNRNPFVDYPGLEDYIWGEKQDVAFSYDMYEGVVQDDDPADDPDPGTGGDHPGTSPTPTDGTIELSNVFFDTGWTGVRPSGTSVSYTARTGGISVTYALGSGSNMYANAEQIRLYPGNTLTVSCEATTLSTIAFSVKENEGGKTLLASTGTMNDYTWQGDDHTVTFSVDSGKGHLKLTAISLGLSKTKGDANGDGLVNVSDVTALINHILGHTPDGFDATAADADGNGLLNVTDVTLIIGIILGEKQTPAEPAATE